MAIFGGTFDPPHLGHSRLLETAQKIYKFDRIFIVPSKYPPQKTPSAPFSKRLSWAKNIFKTSPYSVSDFEAKADSTQFGIDIFYHFAEANSNAEFYWILGEDQFERLEYWKEIDRYASKLQWLVIPRELQHQKTGLMSHRLLKSSMTYQWLSLRALLPASSSHLREHLSTSRSPKSEFLTWIPKSIKDDVIKIYSKPIMNRKETP